MLCHFDGKYRSLRESCFLEKVREELENFQGICSQDSILVFPPLTCQYRFLIHKWVEAYPNLGSVSVGQQQRRRTVIYFAGEREPHGMASPLQANPRTFAGRGRGRRKNLSHETTLEGGKTCQEQSTCRRTRRPDQTFYVPGALKQEVQKQYRGNNRQIGRISRNREDIYEDSSIGSGEKGSDEKIIQSALRNSYNNLQQYRFASDIGSPDRKSNPSFSSDVSTTEHLPVSSSVEEPEPCDSNQIWSKITTDKEEFTKGRTVEGLAFDNSNNVTSNIPAKELHNSIYNSLKLQTEELRATSESDHLSLVSAENGLHKHGEKVEQNKSWLTAESEKGLFPNQDEDEEFSNQYKKVHSKLKRSGDSSNILKEAVINLANVTNENVGLVGCHHNIDEGKVPDSPEDISLTTWSQNCTAVGASHETRIDFVIREQGDESCVSCARSEKESLVKTAEVLVLGERTDKTLLKKPLEKDLDAGVVEHKPTTNATASVDKPDSLTEMKMHSCVSDEGKEGSNECLERNQDVPEQASKDSGDVMDLSLPGDSINNGCSRAVVSLRSVFENMGVQDKEPSEGELDNTIDFQFSEGISETSHLSSTIAQTTEEFVKSKADVKGPLSQPCDIVSVSSGASFIVCSQVVEEPNDVLVGNSPPLAGTVIEKPDKNISSSRCITEVINGYGESKTKKASLETEGKKHGYLEEKAENKDKNGQSDTLFSEENVNDFSTESGKPSRKKTGKMEADKPSKVKTKSKEKAEKKKRKEKRSIKEGNCPLKNLDRGIKKETLHAKREHSTQEKKKEDISLELNSNNESKTTHAMCEPVCDGNNDGDDDGDNDNWEANFDESGDCINPELLAELSKVTGITSPTIHKPQYDYYTWLEPKGIELDDQEFGHITEIYNFSADLTTQDLLQALCAFSTKGFDIKWVDDTHALGIFSSHLAAQEAIRLYSSPLIKLRPVSEGTLQSKKKATRCFEFLQPYKERPKTCKLLADRLVTGALGMKSKITREERVKEREKIKEAKEKKRQERLQKAEIWGD